MGSDSDLLKGQRRLSTSDINLENLKQSGTNVAIYEYEVAPEAPQQITNPIQNFEGFCKLRSWMIFIIANIVIVGSLAIIGIVIGVTMAKGGVGQSCTQDSDCDSNFGLICTSGKCSCLATQYPTTTKCINKKGNGETCTADAECNDQLSLSCSSGTCSCDIYRIYNGTQCILYSTYGEPCTSGSAVTGCNSKYNLICSSNKCTCDSSQNFWHTAYGCIAYKVGGEECQSNSSCRPSTGLYCRTQGSNAGICDCATNYVWNSVTCTTLKAYGQSCVLSSECYTSLYMSCNASNLCGCDSNRYYNGSACILKTTYLTSCTSNTTCDNTAVLYCNGSNCVCSSLSFWDNNTNACLPRKLVGGTCSSVSICEPNTNLLCAATGASMGSCACPSTTFWNGSYCVTKYIQNVTCDSSLQCNELLGLICNNASTFTNQTICDCPDYSYYYNGTMCVQKTNNGTSCNFTSTCKDYCSLYCNSTLKMCLCPDTHYWNGSCCVYKRVYTVPCVYDYQCDDKRNLICPTTVGACKCPYPSIGYTCDCSLSNYWDSTLIMCVPRKSWMGLCPLGNYECQTSGTGLSCLNGICDCPGTAAGWFWNGNMCKKCPTGWTLFGGAYCYYAPSFILDQSGCNDFCSVYTATLLVISNQTEYDFFQSIGNLLIPILGNESFIGLSYASGKWSWQTGAVLANNSPWWCTGHPDPTGAKKCGAMLWRTSTSFCISSSLCYVYGSSICELY